MSAKRTFIVFGMDHYNPLGAIRTLGENGIEPIYIAIPHKAEIASSSCYIQKLHTVKDHIEGCELLLREYGNYPKDALPVVITTDDEQVNYMDEHYEMFKDRFLFFNAGTPGRITRFMDKYEILQLAAKHGLNILPSWTCGRGEIPADLTYPIITKSISPIVGGWKSDVFICEDRAQLEAAYAKIQSPRVVLQRFIEKKNELCIDGFSIDRGRGCFFAIASKYLYNIRGYYSPYMRVETLQEKELIEPLQNVLAEIGFEGIFSIEFLIGPDNTLYFSEINFRNSTWSYGATVAGMPLPILWADAMQSGVIPELKNIDEPFTAIVEPIDYEKRVVERGFSLQEWVKDLKNAKCKYYYHPIDLKPFFVMLEHNAKLR